MTIHIGKGFLIALGAVVLLAGGVAAGLLIAGGSDGNGEETETTEAAATTTTEAAGNPSEDTTAEKEAVEAEDSQSCEALGITPEELNTGTCFEGKTEYVVANKDGTVKLDQLNATLDSIETATVLEGVRKAPKGVYVVARLAITNTTSSPQAYDSFGDQFTLVLCEDSYTEDFNAANNPEVGSFVWRSSNDIQPNQSLVGAAIFDVPEDNTRCLEHDGNLNFGNFRDEYGYGRTKQIGTFRTYH